MERIAISSLRGCLRSGMRGGLAWGDSAVVATRRNIVPAGIARRTAQASTLHRSRIAHSQPISFSQSRTYSTPSSTTSQSAPLDSNPPSDHIVTSLLAPDHLDVNEKEIFDMINAELQPTKLEVKDISGGCGSMYGIEVESEMFRGLSMLKQQRLVNAVVKGKMDKEGWHGVQLRTKVPEK